MYPKKLGLFAHWISNTTCSTRRVRCQQRHECNISSRKRRRTLQACSMVEMGPLWLATLVWPWKHDHNSTPRISGFLENNNIIPSVLNADLIPDWIPPLRRRRCRYDPHRPPFSSDPSLSPPPVQSNTEPQTMTKTGTTAPLLAHSTYDTTPPYFLNTREP